MSAMRVAKLGKSKRLIAYTLTLVFNLSVLLPIPAPAISFNSAPARVWGHIYAATEKIERVTAQKKIEKVEGETKSQWQVTFNNFPNDAKEAVQYAIDIWSRNFSSKVPINVEAVWEKSSNINTLGSARPGYYFNAFPGAPDDSLWYPSALANALAGRDLAPNQKEIFLSINSTPPWHKGTDGQPTTDSYDLVSVVLHEIAHGLGFLSNAEYDKFFGTGYIFQPTPFDAYVQLPDGRTFTDFCSRSAELGKAMLGPLFWSGQFGVSANGGVKPKLYTPNPYVDGSSVTHLDESTFSKSAIDSAMTPNLGPGEVFRSLGPIALAMIDDMLRKPPVGNVTGVPAKPINLKALVGDKYALLSFDSANCKNLNRPTSYLVTINPGGETRSYRSSPIRVTGLKNGRNYTFTLIAKNAEGRSEPVKSNPVKPQDSGRIATIDQNSKVSRLAATDYRGNKAIVYGDEATQTLKIATFNGKRWEINVIRRGVDTGPISICSSGLGSKQVLHIFYGELKSKDLYYSNNATGKWVTETIDGNAEKIQDYREEFRERTASDVSVSNACAITPAGIQIFYRDESQGLLLGATKASNGWIYEIVDGDQTIGSRTTGDVAFSLVAATNGNSVYLLYDSVLTVNSSKQVTQGEVRLAMRQSVFPEDWRYRTLDGPENGNPVAGYSSAIFSKGGKILVAWLTAQGSALPNPNRISVLEIEPVENLRIIKSELFGDFSYPFSLDSGGLVFGCARRICESSLDSSRTRLTSGAFGFSLDGEIITIAKTRYFATSLKGRLTLIRL
jgi:hypothetical protein